MTVNQIQSDQIVFLLIIVSIVLVILTGSIIAFVIYLFKKKEETDKLYKETINLNATVSERADKINTLMEQSQLHFDKATNSAMLHLQDFENRLKIVEAELGIYTDEEIKKIKVGGTDPD